MLFVTRAVTRNMNIYDLPRNLSMLYGFSIFLMSATKAAFASSSAGTAIPLVSCVSGQYLL